MKTLLRNWDVEGHYEFGFGCGFYFSGKRQITKKGVTTAVPYNHEKQIKTFEETLAKMAASAKAEGGCPFIIVDDASPVEVEPERIAEIVGENPMLYLRVDENVGVGGKENILQRALVDRCKYVLKFDVDVQFDSMPLDKIRKGFKTLADAWTITTCIAYFARFEAARLPPGQRYFTSATSSDFLAYRSDVLKQIGFADPALRYWEDTEQRLRALAATGLKNYVDSTLVGKSSPSGAGATGKTRDRLVEYIRASKPFIKVSVPPNGSPRLCLDKKNKDSVKGCFVEALPLAEKLAAKLWR